MSQFNANALNQASQFNKGAQNQFDMTDKAQERFDMVQSMRIEANRIINNHYDNIKKKYAYGFVPSNELEIYLSVNCGIADFRDYKSWKECSKQKLIEFQ